LKHPAHYYHLRFALHESLGPTQPPIHLTCQSFFSEVNRPGREFNNLPRSSDEVKNAWGYKSAPPTRFHGVDWENFIPF